MKYTQRTNNNKSYASFLSVLLFCRCSLNVSKLTLKVDRQFITTQILNIKQIRPNQQRSAYFPIISWLQFSRTLMQKYTNSVNYTISSFCWGILS